ncbi:MAG: hypothetical protein M1536_09070 [Firmicutes bacterium]|nr:hypothetical protein [Bacillota bacterium]
MAQQKKKSVKKEALSKAMPGGMITVSAKATDASGIMSVLVHFEGPAGRTFSGGTNNINAETGMFDCPIHIPENAPNGRYKLSNVILQDNCGNVSYPLQQHPMKLEFEVIGGTCDITPPKLKEVKITSVKNPSEAII